MFTEPLLPIILLAFVCEFIDSSLGMGFGTILAPLLMIVGYQPFQIMPALLLSEFVTGITAGLAHHRFGNVNFSSLVLRDLDVASVLAACGIIGVVVSVLVPPRLPAWALEFYIGLLVLAIGVVVLATIGWTFTFSWPKLMGLGLLAAFNKGIRSGGYGPVVVGGQILAGVESKSAIGIACLAEGVTSAVGVATYLSLTDQAIDWRLAPALLIGSLCSVPLAAYAVKRIPPRPLRILVGVATILLGAYTLLEARV